MGWTYQNRRQGMTTREFFENEIGLDEGKRFLATAVVDNVFYAALELPDGSVTALVILMARARGYHNFGYKDMDERMGPNAASAPARVLDKLTALEECAHPADDRHHSCGTCSARSWRQACRRNAERLALARTVKQGQSVKFARTFEFSNNYSGDTFEWIGRNTFRGRDGLRYNIPGWQSREFVIA